jgi:long-chain acyl-CoA synthetase
MQRAVVASKQPWRWLNQLEDYSIMVVNPDAPGSRYDYLIQNSDYSLLITDQGEKFRDGGNYPNERVYFYTSGTTGDSKFYGFSQHQLDTVCDVMINSYRVTSQDRYYGIMPMWHAHGQTWYWATQRAGCETKFGDINDLKEIENFQPTFLSAIPKILKSMQRLDLNCLRFMRSASVAMPDKSYLDLKRRFDVPVLEAFGMTESISHCFTNPLDGPQKMGTVGLPDGIQARVDTDSHLWIKGPCVYSTDWIDTGDLARIDDDGYYTILGRHIDQINIHGIKINPLSIENQMMNRFPELKECVIFGRDRLKCLFSGNVDLGEVRSWLMSLGNHCWPKILIQVESIPKNNSGKISRSDLEMRFQ